MTGTKKIYDCLIIGGGPAGLSTALGLGRVGRTCIVFSNKKFRNDGIEASHAVLGHDHIHPQQILARGRDQIKRYGNTTFAESEITRVERKDMKDLHGRKGFLASTSTGDEWIGRTLVMATGVKDIFPDLPGYAENWPANIYQCLFCDGFERREGPKGQLCLPSFNPGAAKMATMLLHLDPKQTSKVTVFANGEPNPNNDPTIEAALKQCAANGIEVDPRKIVRLESRGPENEGLYVHLKNANGKEEAVYQSFVSHKPPTAPSTPGLIEQLGLETVNGPFGDYIKATAPFQSTNIPGVFTAGDSGVFMTHVTNAMFTGVCVAGGVAHFLNEWDDEVALEALNRDSKMAQNMASQVHHSNGDTAAGMH